MSGFFISFRPAAGQEEALGRLAVRTGALAEELTGLAAQLGGYGGMEVFAAALSGLSGQISDSARVLDGLGVRLGEIQACYTRAERRMLARMDGLEAEAAQSVSAGPDAGTVAEVSTAAGGGGMGGVSGTQDEGWSWFWDDHSAWEAGTQGSAWGGVLAGSAGVSLLDYESEFKAGGEWDSEDGLFAGLSGGGTFSTAGVDAEGRIGEDWLALYGEAAGDLGVVTTTGAVGVFQDDGELFAGVRGEAGLYAAQGEVTGGLDLGFMRIGGTLEGNVGVGAGVELGYDDGTIRIGATATPGVGGGFSLAIDLSPTIDFIAGLFDD